MTREVRPNLEGRAHGHILSSKFSNTKICKDKLMIILSFRLGFFSSLFIGGWGVGGWGYWQRWNFGSKFSITFE